MSSNTRIIKDAKEIWALLEDAVGQKIEVIISQKLVNERKIMLGKFQYLDLDQNLIILNPLQAQHFNLDSQFEVTVKSEFKGLSFKAKIHFIKDTLLLISIPLELHIEDLREKKRKRIDIIENQYLTLTVVESMGNQNDSSAIIREKPLTILSHGKLPTWDLKIIDINKDGASVEIDESLKNQIEDFQHFLLVALTGVVLPQSIVSQLIYLRPLKVGVEKDQDQFFRVGLKFQTELSSAALSLLELNSKSSSLMGEEKT